MDEEVRAGAAGRPRNRLKMRQFPVFAYPEEARMAPRGAPESLGRGRNEENGFNGGRWV